MPARRQTKQYNSKYCIEIVDSLINTVIVLSCETHLEKCAWTDKIETFFSTDHVCTADNIKNKAGGGIRRSKDIDAGPGKDAVNITWDPASSEDYQMLPTMELND